MKIIEGTFNGQHMIGDDKITIYIVNPNYASKSKLVEGDRLKLTITDDGVYTYKQIEVVPRDRGIGEAFTMKAHKGMMVNVEGKKLKLLSASVSYFKIKDGDRIAVSFAENDPKWAAIEGTVGDFGS